MPDFIKTKNESFVFSFFCSFVDVNDSRLKPRASKTDSETLSEIQESCLPCDKISYWM